MEKTLDINELNRLYDESEQVDQEVYSEQRSNILLVSGQHYAKRNQYFMNRLRESNFVTPEQKIRLTKNHIQNIMKKYENIILSYSPAATAAPNNKQELQDIKAAELHRSVIVHGRKKYDFKKKIRDQCEDFFRLGETFVKIYWDPSKGKFLGYKASTDEQGNVEVDDAGNPVASKEAVFSGDFAFERIYGFNVFRPKEAKSFDDALWVGIRKMVDKEHLKKLYPDHTKEIQDSTKATYVVFDGMTSSYKQTDKECMVREFYYRPCYDYPNGQYFICVDNAILEQGDLPFGVFPLVYQTCEEFQTSPRGRSPIVHLRPYQAEINRAGSKQAEHQITLGDDKLVMVNGSKITQGAALPGVRTMHVNGQPPVVIQGRTGEQYVNYVLQNIEEMYQIAMIPEILEDKQDGNIDPYALLFKSLRQKKNFSMYIDKFEAFVLKFHEVFLELARQYLPEDELISMIGRNEIVNISEFKNAKPLGYQIILEQISEDVDTLMGRQLVLNHVLQFVGPQLTRDDIGKMISQMPFADSEDAFSDFTLDYESATNIILSLDRGVPPTTMPSNKQYTLNKVVSRRLKSDFQFLDPRTQFLYSEYEKMLSESIAMDLQLQKAMNADLIPSQGFLVTCDFYVPDPMKPGSNKRARIPMDSLAWLIQRLEAQGTSLEQLQQAPEAAQRSVAQQAVATMQGIDTQGQMSQFLAGQTNPQGETSGQSNPSTPNILTRIGGTTVPSNSST